MTAGVPSTPDGIIVNRSRETEVAISRNGGLTVLDLKKLMARLEELEVRDTARVLTAMFGGYIGLSVMAVKDSDRSSDPLKP